MVTADVFDGLPELLNSGDAKVREWTVKLLDALANHTFALNLISNSNLCTQLVLLSRRVKFPMLDFDADFPQRWRARCRRDCARGLESYRGIFRGRPSCGKPAA
jgi:hypothetical protein